MEDNFMENKTVRLTYGDETTKNIVLSTDYSLYYAEVPDSHRKYIRMERLIERITETNINDLKVIWNETKENVIKKAELVIGEMVLGEVTNSRGNLYIQYIVKDDAISYSTAKEIVDFSDAP